MPARFPQALTAPIPSSSTQQHTETAKDPAIGLSGGFKAVLGRSASGLHDPAHDTSVAALVRAARSEGRGKPMAPAGARTHIGPRSGHK
jgi:hypothetical protein